MCRGRGVSVRRVALTAASLLFESIAWCNENRVLSEVTVASTAPFDWFDPLRRVRVPLRGRLHVDDAACAQHAFPRLFPD